MALFAPDAIVRERRGPVPADVWDTRDPQVVHAHLDGSPGGLAQNPSGLIWVAGRQEIGTWAAARFARYPRSTAGQLRVAGDTVTWRYREYADPYRPASGFSPLEGDAEAVVHGGQITLLSLVQSPESVQRQQDEVRAVTARMAPLNGDESSAPAERPQDANEPVEPVGAAWPLALGGLALLAVATMALRRRRRP